MTSSRAIDLAIEHIKDEKSIELDLGGAKATYHKDNNSFFEEDFKEYWSVVIPIVQPENKIICPGEVIVLVNNDEQVKYFDELWENIK